MKIELNKDLLLAGPTKSSRFVLLAALFVLSSSLSSAGTWVAFGPKTYTRGTGAPVAVTDTFTLLNPATQYTLKAFNGGLQDDTTELVSSCVVLVNGVQVIGPGNFNKNVSELDVPVTLLASNTISVQVKGKPGGVLVVEIIGVDNDPPTISASLNPPPNAAGWNNSPVTVTFTCSDKTSGVASCSSPVSVSTEGANQVVSGTAIDLAGNTATTSVTLNLDMTPPIITGSINPQPDAAGYNSGPVTVTFSCSDALSGVASCSPPISMTSEGTFTEYGNATDVAGNTATTTITVNISFNYFKIQSWQTGPNGNAKSPSGKCLDYGASPSGASVFLNDCSNAHAIRVFEMAPRDQKDSQGNTIPFCSTQDNPPPNPPTAHTFCHEVMLFAGNQVIGIHNPPVNIIGGSGTPPLSTLQSEYALELQDPGNGIHINPQTSPGNQIFALDGDSIILEISRPCVNTDTTTSSNICPAPPSQMVIQIQKARGANGSPIVAGVRNLADNEFWDFVAIDGSGKDPTSGFIHISTSVTADVDLWNAICKRPTVKRFLYNPAYISDPGNLDDGQLLHAAPCTQFQPGLGWGSVIVLDPQVDSGDGCTSTDSGSIGPCIDFSQYEPLLLPAGATIRGSRRGTNFGPQLYLEIFPGGRPDYPTGVCGMCLLDIHGDYARVTGLRLRGQSRTTDTSEPYTDGIAVGYPGLAYDDPATMPFPATPAAGLSLLTEYIATIDHNDGSDWGDAAVVAGGPFARGADANHTKECRYSSSYVGNTTPPQSSAQVWYPCDQNAYTVPFPPYSPLGPPVSVVQDPFPLTVSATGTVVPTQGTLTNLRISRNFLHDNRRNEGGYGASIARAMIDANTFNWNRHDITSSGEPHSQYHASHNLALSSTTSYPVVGRLQDFDMHGTNWSDVPFVSALYFGGAGGYYVEIDGNTFLGQDRPDYKLRGYPVNNTDYHGNVSMRNQTNVNVPGPAVQFMPCSVCNTFLSFPINVSGDNQFGNSTPPYTDPTAQLGVGDFDGDGDDDLFLTTGAAWYYSPAGAREWRFLSAKTDRIDSLLLGDFDGDGRTDVVGINPSNQLVVSWGGVSDWEVLNTNPLPCTSTSDMAVGDFDGDGHADIFCADGATWWISYGGSTSFVQVIVADSTRVKDLRFGDFNGDGTTDVFGVVSGAFATPQWQVRYGPKGYQGLLGGWQPLPFSLTSTIDGLYAADFLGIGRAVVAKACDSPQGSWCIAEGYPTWTPYNVQSSALYVGGVGHFGGRPNTNGNLVDLLLWNGNEFSISEGGIFPAGPWSTQDMR